MSAVNILLHRDRAVLCTDTKATNSDGVQHHVLKYAILPWMRMAVAVRGYVGALRVFERAIAGSATTYEGAVQFLVEHFADVLATDYVDATEAFAMRQDVDVYLVGYGMNGPAAHWVSNYRTNGQVQKIDGVHISPMPDLEAQRRYASDPKGGIPRLMADQAAQNPGVGGWMMVTEIHEDHIATYPHGGLCALSSVASRIQPKDEKEALAAIDAANDARAERKAALAG
ncbi:MAG: hypothetical protein QHC90_23220 [Shinella sp.]|nr:hypothetical protein [Shinella sp.]